MMQTNVPGGVVQWTVDGPDEGVNVVFCHGTPQGLQLDGSARAALIDAGARVVGIARPGYGGSTRRRGRRVVDVVDDVRVVLDELGVSEFRALGWSGGGPHSLAVAANVDGCVGVTVIAGIAPFDFDGWYDGMGEANVDEFKAAEAGEAALRALIDPALPILANLPAEHLVVGLGDLLAPADRDALSPGEAEVFATSVRQALSSGNDGQVDDELAFVHSWGFDVGTIDVPVTIWHGQQDRMVPARHAARLKELIDHAAVHVIPDDGHLSIFLGNTREVAASVMS